MQPQPFVPKRMPPVVRILLILSIIGAVLLAALVSLRFMGLLRPYQVPTNGMSPSLQQGDHILVEKVSGHIAEPKRGDILVFSTKSIEGPFGMHGRDLDFIQRLAGLPGEQLRIENEHLLVNGKVADELKNLKYTTVSVPNGLDMGRGVTVPAEHYFMLGDNTQNSLDSRYWGFVPKRDIKGTYWFHFWRNPGNF